jgi:hypothetical protein
MHEFFDASDPRNALGLDQYVSTWAVGSCIGIQVATNLRATINIFELPCHISAALIIGSPGGVSGKVCVPRRKMSIQPSLW